MTMVLIGLVGIVLSMDIIETKEKLQKGKEDLY